MFQKIRKKVAVSGGSRKPEETHESEETASKKRRVSRKIRRYEVPIESAGEGDSQTILRFKPLGFWKMFFAVMLGFFTALLLFLATAVVSIIILGGILWGFVEDRISDWVVDVANQVSEELEEAEESVSNIADRLEETVENIGEQVSEEFDEAEESVTGIADQIDETVENIGEEIDDAIDQG